MPTNKAFHRRIQILDQCLRRRQMVWTVNALLEATNAHLADHGYPEISIRTLYDDLRYLQETLIAPVEKYQQGKQVCYRYSDPAYTLVNSPLSEEEKAVLRKMLEYLKVNGLPMQEEITALLNRHGIVAEPDLARSVLRMKKAESINKDYEEIISSNADAKASAAPSPSGIQYHSSGDILLNRLVLRMELDEYAAYRNCFWSWLESGV
jgi:predicted DNA-binding transcriptional regulator YafY